MARLLTDREKLKTLEATNELLKRENRLLAKRDRAEERIVSYIEEAVDALPPAKPPKPRPASKVARTQESLVQLWSCWHIGEVIDKDEMGGMNAYDFDIFCQRLQYCVDRTISFAKANMATHNFKTLWLIHLGDAVSGIIHKELEETNEIPITMQAIMGSAITAQAIRELCAEFEQVKFIGMVGNHGRTEQQKRSKGKAIVNWDYVFYTLLCARLADQPNFSAHIPESYWHLQKIEGWNFHLAHGDNVRASGGVPFQGLMRDAAKWAELLASQGKICNYFIRSHYHTSATLQTPTGELMLNGSLKGTCEYAASLPVSNDPEQFLFGVHPKYGRTWRLPIEAKFAKGPLRYQVGKKDLLIGKDVL